MAINQYTKPVQQSLEEYVPVPLDTLFKAGQHIQQRGDAVEQSLNQTESGLRSIKALAPAHKDYINKLAENAKGKFREVVDKYGENLADPEAGKEVRKLISQFVSDPNLQTIMQANKGLEQRDQIAAKLRAEGKLFINPQFTGLDETGNLTSDVGQVSLVDVLDKWDEDRKMAWQSMVNDGKGTISNEPNLSAKTNEVSNAIANNTPEVQLLLSPQGLSQRTLQKIKALITLEPGKTRYPDFITFYKRPLTTCTAKFEFRSSE